MALKKGFGPLGEVYSKVVSAWRPQSQRGHPSAIMWFAGILHMECLQLTPSL